MEKKHLTDGLLQIAILLSFLRTNVDDYLNLLTGYNQPGYELSDILYGSTSVITQTSHFQRDNWDSDLGGYIHPKNVDSYISRSVFRDLYVLGDYNEVAFQRISTYLLPNIEQRLQVPNEGSNPNSYQQTANDDNNNSHDSSSANTQTVESSPPQDNVQLYSPNVIADELSQEDMDLIEILWRQDIDMGVGKECFDINLRRELEKEQELQDEKLKAKKEQEEKSEADSLHDLTELSQTVNLIVDGETGELVPAPEAPENQSELTSEQGLSIEEAIEILQDHSAPAERIPSTSSSEDGQTVIPELEDLLQNLRQPTVLSRQVSIERRWSDVQDLIGVDFGHGQSNVNVIGSVTSTSTLSPAQSSPQQIIQPITMPSQSPSSTMTTMEPANLLQTPFVTSSTSVVYDVTGDAMASRRTQGALIQNATLGSTQINTTELLQAAIDTSVMPPVDNETGTMFHINNTDTALFPNASISNSTNFLLDLLEENNADDGNMPFTPQSNFFTPIKSEDPLSDSALGSMGGSSIGSTSPFSSDANSNVTSPFDINSAIDELEGATGGLDEIITAPKDIKPAHSYRFYDGGAEAHPRTDYHYPDQSNMSDSNSSDSSMSSFAPALPRHVQHNHTYPAPPGQEPKERKCDVNARMMKNRNTTNSRDVKKARELQLPFTVEDIINSPVETFGDMLTKYKLTEPQLQLMKDIRRRGKNKVAAQNCRKRKMEVIETLEEEVERMRRERDTMSKTRGLFEKERDKVRDKYNMLYREVFNSLRDEHGQPYDPSEYTLQHTSDGNVFLVPKNTTTTSSASGGLAAEDNNNRRNKNGSNKKRRQPHHK